jgi:DNA-binding NarL/FixJ family response regulator
VLIAEDHRVVADGLVLLLGERYEIVATVRDGSDVLDAARRLHPDVILLDVSMPHVSGLESMRQLGIGMHRQDDHSGLHVVLA